MLRVAALLLLTSTVPAFAPLPNVFSGFSESQMFPGWCAPEMLSAMAPSIAPASARGYSPAVRNRSLRTYQNAFGDSFDDKLRDVRRWSGHWVDIGAGEGAALRDLVFDGPDVPFVTGVSLEPPPEWMTNLAGWTDWRDYYYFEPASRVTWVSGAFGSDEFPRHRIEPADIVTDLLGAFSYQDQPDVVLYHELSLLKKGGSLFLEVVPTNTTIYRRNGRRTFEYGWLSSIQGIELKTFGTPTPSLGWHPYPVEVKRIPGRQVRIPRLRPVYILRAYPDIRVLVETVDSWVLDAQ